MVSSESIIGPWFPEKDWVIEIKEFLENPKEAEEIVVSIFEVPEMLRSVNPSAYGPQLIAFGPYHYFRPKLYGMQRFKVEAALKAQNDWRIDFQQLIEEVKNHEVKIRSCYQKHLNFESDTLAYMMVIDGLSLFKVLNRFVYFYKNPLDENSFIEFSKINLDFDMVVRDILMLENQIPMMVLKKIAEKWAGSENLYFLVEFVESFSPLELAYKPTASEVDNYKHLLDLFYQSICPKQERGKNSCTKQKVEISQKSPTTDITVPTQGSAVLTKLLAEVSKLPFRFATLPAKLLNLVLTFFELFGISPQNFFDIDRNWIPTATQLKEDAGLKFSTCPSINDIKFEFDSQTLSLPVITLNSEPTQDNTCCSKLTLEVILRNLVAFESLSKENSESLPFTRYTQLMNGIINTPDDVNLLKKAEIIKGDLDNTEISNLFNGLSESIEPKDRDINIDEAIKNVNSFYDSALKVKANKLLKKYIYSSWKFITVLATFLLLALLALELFCDFYACRVIRFKSA